MLNRHLALSVAAECSDLHILIDAVERTNISRIHAKWSQLSEWLACHSIDVTKEDAQIPLGGDAHLNGLDISSLTIECDEDFDTRTDDAYMQMRVARNLGLRQVTVTGGSQNSASRDYLVAALLRLTTLADRLGLDVLLGNRRGTCVEQVDDMVKIFADVGAQNLYADIDIVEFHAACVNPGDACLALGASVANVRLSNADGVSRTSLEQGEINIPAFLRAMESAGCDCPFVITLANGSEAGARLLADLRFLEGSGFVIQ